jgi:cysteine synthase
VRYRPEIFSLYEDLFKEAQAALAKPGLLRRGIGWLTGGTTRNAVRSAEQIAQQGAQHAQVARESGEVAKDLQQRLRVSNRAANQKDELLRQFDANPNALPEAQQARTVAEQAAAQHAQRATGMGHLAAGLGAAGAIGGTGAYLYGRHGAEAERKRTRNLAFGAGAAAGLAAPTVIRGLGNIAQGVGQTGLFPEMQGYEGVNPNTYTGGY